MHIESTNLLLRWLQPSDLEDMLEYRADPAVLRHQGMAPFSREKARRFIEEQSKKQLDTIGQWMQIGIQQRSNRKLIGDCALKFRAAEPRIVELGYTINPRFQGQGLATEAIGALLTFLFKDRGVHKAVALVDVRNWPSVRVLEKLGFRREGHLRKSYYDEINGAWFDEYWYGLLSEEC